MSKVIEDVIAERKRQDAKWGEQLHDPYKWITILGEEFGEVCEASLTHSWESDYRDELVQVAAVAIAAIECHDKLAREAAEELKDMQANIKTKMDE